MSEPAPGVAKILPRGESEIYFTLFRGGYQGGLQTENKLDKVNSSLVIGIFCTWYH